MSFHLVKVQLQAGFRGLDEGLNDSCRLDLTDTHSDELEKPNAHTRCTGGNSKPDGYEAEEEDKEDDCNDNDCDDETAGEPVGIEVESSSELRKGGHKIS